jgi:DNA-binding NtrC family response regulator
MIVAPTAINVLIQGGCAAERVSVAGAIHNLSERRHAAFIRVNCSELGSERLDAELFGDVRDRSTASGFARCKTHFEDAFNGTLFLNNVDSLPGRLQLRLLHALKNRELLKKSAKRRYKIDVRLIASSERNLATLVKRSQFDPELYNLLKIFAIDVPSNDNQALIV